MTKDTYNIENVLVEQKNSILSLLKNNKPAEALASLAVVADLWRLTDYGYKLREIAEQIQNDYKETYHATYAGVLIAALKYAEAIKWPAFSS